MAAILCFGASGTYGVGGQRGGWPEYLKEVLHQAQYGPRGSGEWHEVFNLGVAGHGVDDVSARLSAEVSARRRAIQPKVISIISVGLNDSRAVERSDNFVSTPEAYQEKMSRLFVEARAICDSTLALGFAPVDERRTCPKIQPVTGHKSFFTNERAELFESRLLAAAEEAGVPGLPLFQEAIRAGWSDKLSADGLHPNDAGYQWIAERVLAGIREIL